MAPSKSKFTRAVALSGVGCIVGIYTCAKAVFQAIPTLISTNKTSPSPNGLLLGLGSVAAAQALLVAYQYHRRKSADKLRVMSIQLKDYKYDSSFFDDAVHHVKRVELLLLVPYLAVTWMLNLMPSSYYDLNSAPSAGDVILQLLFVDFFTYSFHLILHTFPKLYIPSHKPHHKFTNPQLFDAFNATVIDTVCLILFPL